MKHVSVIICALSELEADFFFFFFVGFPSGEVSSLERGKVWHLVQ